MRMSPEEHALRIINREPGYNRGSEHRQKARDLLVRTLGREFATPGEWRRALLPGGFDLGNAGTDAARVPVDPSLDVTSEDLASTDDSGSS